MLWVYGHFKFYSFSAGIEFRRQNLPSKVGPRAERVDLIYLFTVNEYVMKSRIVKELQL